MLVSELIELLQKMPQDQIVILSSDEEGNSYRELIAESMFPDHGWDPDNREIGLLKLSTWDRTRGYAEEDVIEGGIPCLILG